MALKGTSPKLPEILENIRKIRGLTVTDFADVIGSDRAGYYGILKGNHSPGFRFIQRVLNWEVLNADEGKQVLEAFLNDALERVDDSGNYRLELHSDKNTRASTAPNPEKEAARKQKRQQKIDELTELFKEPLKTANGKPVFEIPATSVLNDKSGFGKKLLCDDLTFTAGSTCGYSCSFCYVESILSRSAVMLAAKEAGYTHEKIIVRRKDAIKLLEKAIFDRHGKPKRKDAHEKKVIYASPLVDIAANMEMVKETIEMCRILIDGTNWDIRLLSKSSFLPKIAKAFEDHKDRFIFGVSTGTLDDGLAKAFEQGTAKVSRRIESLHWLQDNGFRTYGMICPSLPQEDPEAFSKEICETIRVEKCEHVWAEPLNAKGEAMASTVRCLRKGGFDKEADLLQATEDKEVWEQYARATFMAHTKHVPPEKLRFLQYVSKATRPWWEQRRNLGAVLL